MIVLPLLSLFTYESSVFNAFFLTCGTGVTSEAPGLMALAPQPTPLLHVRAESIVVFRLVSETLLD